MASRLTPTRVFTASALALPVLLLGKQAWDVHSKVSPTPRRQITTYDAAPDSLHNSPTVRNLVNPRGHVTTSDGLFIDVDIPEKARALSDETLLAAFVRGFFGGEVFAMERGALSLFRAEWANARFSAVEKAPTPVPVWDTKRLEGDALPELYTHLFGAFQVTDLTMSAPRSLESERASSTSSVDVAFGSDMHQFSGVHRFSIIRDRERPERLRIDCAHVTCNPAVNKPLSPQFLFAFHKMYSMLLFRESVGEVVRRMEAGC